MNSSKTIECLSGVFFMVILLSGYCFGFEKKDLERMKQRLVFYERGSYAVALPNYATAPLDEQKKHRGTTATIYYISRQGYDPIFSVNFLPLSINEELNQVTFTSGNSIYTLKPEGVNFSSTHHCSEPSSGLIFCFIKLHPIRFDDALCYRKQGEGFSQQLLKPYALEPNTQPYDADTLNKFFTAQPDIKPTYVIRTEEGLWTLWEFNLKTEKVGSLYSSQDASIIIPSGGAGPIFYNTASKIEAGGMIDFSMKCKVIADEKFPLPIKPAPRLTLFDTHIHRTVLTDLRDSALMARKHGYKYGLLSILFNEGPYARLFLGDPDMFDAMQRYPDIFVGFGLIQLNEVGYPGFPHKGSDTPEHVVELWKNGCKGIKIIEKWSQANVDDPKFDPIYDKISELKMPLVFHTEPEGGGCSCMRVAKVAGKFPQMSVVMAHLHNDKQLEAIIPYLKRLPNLYLQSGNTKTLVDEGLAIKIIWGSDSQNDYSGLISSQYDFSKKLEKLGVSEADIARIMYGTAEQWISQVKPVSSK